jgi:hypothetical protein
MDAAPIDAREWTAWAGAAIQLRAIRMLPWTAAMAMILFMPPVTGRAPRGSAPSSGMLLLVGLIGALMPMITARIALAFWRSGAVARTVGILLISAVIALAITTWAAFGMPRKASDDAFMITLLSAVVILLWPLARIAAALAWRTHPGVTHADERRAWFIGGMTLSIGLFTLMTMAVFRIPRHVWLDTAFLPLAAIAGGVLLLPTNIRPARRYAALYDERPIPVISFVVLTTMFCAYGIQAAFRPVVLSTTLDDGHQAAAWVVFGGALMTAYGLTARRLAAGIPWGSSVASFCLISIVAACAAILLSLEMPRSVNPYAVAIGGALYAVGLMLLGVRPLLRVPPAPKDLPPPEHLATEHHHLVSRGDDGALLVAWRDAIAGHSIPYVSITIGVLVGRWIVGNLQW